MSCPFCLSSGKVRILWENEVAYIVAARDSDGILMPGRYLIIPKNHIEKAEDLPNLWHVYMMDLVRKTPEHQDGVDHNINRNQGKAAGQRIKHVHEWLIFREGEEGTQAEDIGLAAMIAYCRSIPK